MSGEIGVAIAFAGGVLSILSPCSAFLLPAFFALAFTSRVRLLGQAALFFLGLATIFVPLGLGVSAVAALFIGQRDLVIVAAGALLVGLGIYVLAGGGFELAPGIAGRLHGVQGRWAAYATGLAYGFAGFCTGPILGAVLTVAAASDEVVVGGLLLATYALGMSVPVFLLAIVWDRWHLGERRWLRAAMLRIGPLEMPLTRALSGALFVAVGIVYVMFRGSSALSGIYADIGLTDLSHAVEIELSRGAAVPVALALAAIALALVWPLRRLARP
jgi:cytochrome c biogenesis protein CcdA